jgi:signal transduction protein with GAF and PtsI domain
VETEQAQTKTEVEWVHEISGHIAAGDTLDEALAATVSFAIALVNCDFCFIYVREAAELVLWVWKHLEHGAVDHTNLPLGQSYTAFLAQHRAPIAISPNRRDHSELKLFHQWSADPGETFVSVPLLARKELMGVINLHHRQPRRYSLREVKLLSSVGFLLGADIGISRRQSQNSNLLLELETRKLVERGKGILQCDLGLSEEQAYLVLQRQSRQKRKSIKEIAQAVILGDEFKRSAMTDPALVRRTSNLQTQRCLKTVEGNPLGNAAE